MTTPRSHRRRLVPRAAAGVLGLLLILAGIQPAFAAGYQRISGSGSSWAGNALAQWVSDVKKQGVTVDYNPAGSSTGRKEFALGAKQFAVSEIPYHGDTADPQDNTYPENYGVDYTMLPLVSGGTSFMYNLRIGSHAFEDLKLSQQAIAKIFSGQASRWNDPVIAADNPGVALPDQQITVVVRSDGSGATAQFTLWMLRQFPDDYKYLCNATGACDGVHATSYYPIKKSALPNFVAQNQSAGVTTYTQQTQYSINYDEYSYANQIGFPVAQVKNAAGYYTVPKDTNVAVALTQAKINTDKNSDNYLSQDLSNVYAYGDPRTYPLSMYTYGLVPTKTNQYFGASQGATLGYFDQYALCEGQRSMGDLGYSPLPMNLVLAALDEVLKIPGVDQDTQNRIAAVKAGTASGGSNPCNNPTFRPGDSPSHNVLVDTAPFPAGCDAACQAPWKKAGSGNNGGPNYDDGNGGTNNGGTGSNDNGGNNDSGNGGTDNGGNGGNNNPDQNAPDNADTPTALNDGDSAVEPGGTYQVDLPAGTFTAGGKVEVVLRSDPVTMPEGTAAADGSLSYKLTLPTDLEAGQHTLTFTDATDSSRVQVISFTVGDPTANDQSGGDQVCDPDTGECVSTGGGVRTASYGAASQVPTVLPGTEGWARPQTLMVIVGALMLILVFGPAAVGRVTGRRRPSRVTTR